MHEGRDQQWMTENEQDTGVSETWYDISRYFGQARLAFLNYLLWFFPPFSPSLSHFWDSSRNIKMSSWVCFRSVICCSAVVFNLFITTLLSLSLTFESAHKGYLSSLPAFPLLSSASWVLYNHYDIALPSCSFSNLNVNTISRSFHPHWTNLFRARCSLAETGGDLVDLIRVGTPL